MFNNQTNFQKQIIKYLGIMNYFNILDTTYNFKFYFDKFVVDAI